MIGNALAKWPADILGRQARTARTVAPGLLVCVTVAMAATFVSDHYGGPTLLYALLLGIAFYFLSQDARTGPGIGFAARTVLRLGVALLGARITAEQILGLGLTPILTVIAGVVLTVVFGRLVSTWLGLDRAFGLLTGGAVAICGASAALAISAVLPRHAHAERDTILTVVGVTTLSTLAMVLYPFIVSGAGFAPTDAGIFLGATIHDVAQVVGAGYMVSSEVGDVATFTKLLRVAMLVPVVLALSVVVSRSSTAGSEGKARVGLPAFLVAFVIIVAANSANLIPTAAAGAMVELSRWCLVTAIAGLGMKTSFQELAVVGWRPVALMVAETVFLAVLVLVTLLAIVGS